MPTRKNRQIRGGFKESPKIWSKSFCSTIVDLVKYPSEKIDKRSTLEMLKYLADRVKMTPEDLYNKITPDEFLTELERIGDSPHDLYLSEWEYGKHGTKYTAIPLLWKNLQQKRDTELKKGHKWGKDYGLELKPLPGSNKKKTVKNNSVRVSGN